LCIQELLGKLGSTKTVRVSYLHLRTLPFQERIKGATVPLSSLNSTGLLSHLPERLCLFYIAPYIHSFAFTLIDPAVPGQEKFSPVITFANCLSNSCTRIVAQLFVTFIMNQSNDNSWSGSVCTSIGDMLNFVTCRTKGLDEDNNTTDKKGMMYSEPITVSKSYLDLQNHDIDLGRGADERGERYFPEHRTESTQEENNESINESDSVGNVFIFSDYESETEDEDTNDSIEAQKRKSIELECGKTILESVKA